MRRNTVNGMTAIPAHVRTRKLSSTTQFRRRITALATVCVLGIGVGTYPVSAVTTTKPKPKASAADLRKRAVLDLYGRQKALQVRYLSNRTTTLIVPKEGSSVFSGVRLDFALKDEARYQQDGVFYDLEDGAYDSFDLRVSTLSSTIATLRVCERFSAFRFRKSDGQRSDPNEGKTSTTDLELTAVYSSKKKTWLISKGQYLEPEEGKSKCAEGK